MRAGRGVCSRKLRTAKPCGPGTRCWCQAGGGLQAPNRAMRATNSPATEARGIRLRGDHGISRKTIAQGKPGVPAHLRSAVCIFAHDCGCHGHPAFPAPSAFARASMTHNFGRYPRREIAMSHPVPITPVEDNYGHRRPPARPPLFAAPHRFRGARGLSWASSGVFQAAPALVRSRDPMAVPAAGPPPNSRKTPVFREFRQLRSEPVHKPQLYPICSEIAAHCDPSLRPD